MKSTSNRVCLQQNILHSTLDPVIIRPSPTGGDFSVAMKFFDLPHLAVMY